MIDLDSFTWRTFNHYRVDVVRFGSDVIRPGGITEERRLVRDCGPLDYRIARPFHENSALFFSFAAVTSDDDVVEFANTFGHLRGGGSVNENLRGWLADAEAMREAIALWEALKGGDAAALEKMDRTAASVERKRRAELDLLEPLPVSRPDNRELRPRMASRLSTVLSEILADPDSTETVVGYDDETTRFGLWTRPRTLLGGMWLQLAAAAIGNIEHRQCRFCGAWMAITPELNRTQKVFCTDRCKAKDYRNRRLLAEKMAASGATIKNIAKATSTPIETINRWISREEEPHASTDPEAQTR